MLFERIQSEVKFVAVRSRGPGGQNVNKVSSAAILLWDFNNSQGLTEIQRGLIRQKLQNSINKDGFIFLRSDEHRDLERNKARCLEKLQELLVMAFHVPKYRRPTKPSRSSKIKKQEFKSRRSDIKKNRQKVR